MVFLGDREEGNGRDVNTSVLLLDLARLLRRLARLLLSRMQNVRRRG
jgi:hypothetical protein